jgi:hypothetical protein
VDDADRYSALESRSVTTPLLEPRKPVSELLAGREVLYARRLVRWFDGHTNSPASKWYRISSRVTSASR